VFLLEERTKSSAINRMPITEDGEDEWIAACGFEKTVYGKRGKKGFLTLWLLLFLGGKEKKGMTRPKRRLHKAL